MLFANEHSTYWETATNPLLDAVAGVIEPPQLSAPVFTLLPTDKSAKIGATVTFTAMAKGNPSPKIKWYSNSGFFGDGNSVTFLATENEVIRCLAYNSEGEAAVDVHLTIEIVEPPTSDLEQRVAKLEAFEQEAQAFYAKVKGVFE